MEEIRIRTLRDSQKDKLKSAEEFFDKKPAPAAAPDQPEKKRRHLPLLAAKFILFTLFVLLVGGVGGILLDRIVLPNLLVQYPQLNQYEYLKRVNERTTIVEKTEEVHISQEEAISDAIARVSPAIVSVENKDAGGAWQRAGTGIILTSDGYLITARKNVLGAGDTPLKELRVTLASGKSYDAALGAQDAGYGLAVLKIGESNLSVIPYADTSSLKLGQRLVLIGDAVASDIVAKLLTDYKPDPASAEQKRIRISTSLDPSFIGCAVISPDGNLVGVGQGGNLVVPLDEIRSFIDASTRKN